MTTSSLATTRAAPTRAVWPATYITTVLICGMVGAVVFDRPSNFCLPGSLGSSFSKMLDAGMFGLLALWMLYRRHLPRLNVPMLLAFAYVGHAWMSGMWAMAEDSYHENIRRLFRVAFAGLALYFGLRTRDDVEHAVLGLKILSFVAAILIILEMVWPGFRLGGQQDLMIQYEVGFDEGFQRARGPWGHPNSLGFFYGVTLLMTPYLWSRYPKGWCRLLLAATVPIEVLALLLGYVRLGLAGAAVGGAWLWMRGALRHRMLMLMAALGGVAALIPLMPEAWQYRVADPDHWQEDESLLRRTAQQITNVDMAVAHCGTGVGYGCYGDILLDEGTGDAADDARQHTVWFGKNYRPAAIGSHNSYLEIIIEQGVVGILLFGGCGLALFLGMLGTAAGNRRDRPAWQLGVAFEAMVVSMGVMDGVLHTQDHRIGWVVIGIGSAFISISRHGLMRPGDAPAASERYMSPLRLALVALAFAAVTGLMIYESAGGID